LAHFLAQFQWFEHFNAVAVAQQFAQEITGGTDVEREIGIVGRRFKFLLGVMQGQCAQGQVL
jgi:hypothetical protein